MSQVLTALLVAVVLFQDPSLDSASPKERAAAIEKMAIPGNSSAIAPLAEAFKKEPKSDLRAEILAGLARIREKAAIVPLAEALRTDTDKDVRLQAIDSLLRLYIPMETSGPLRTIYSKVRSAFFAADRPMVGPQVAVDGSTTAALADSMQKDFVDEVRIEAARALGSLKARDQMAVLIATLDDPKNREHEEVRLEVIRTLGIIRDPAAGPVLEKYLRDPDNQIVGEAAASVGLVGYKEARPAVEQLFRTSGNRAVRRRSLETLSLMRDPASAAFFEALLGHRDDYYRELAADGLARLHHDPAILKQRRDQEKKTNVRNALAFALAASGEPSYINELANALDTRQEYQVRVYLIELGQFEGQLPELYRYLRSTNPRVRARMISVIGDIGNPASREQIQPMTADPDINVVREAVDALRKLTK